MKKDKQTKALEELTATVNENGKDANTVVKLESISVNKNYQVPYPKNSVSNVYAGNEFFESYKAEVEKTMREIRIGMDIIRANEYQMPIEEITDDKEEITPSKKGLSVSSVLVFILAVASLAVMALGQFVRLDYFYMAGGKSAVELIILGVNGIIAGSFSIFSLLTATLLVVSAVLFLGSAIGSIVTLGRKGKGKVMKIFNFVNFIVVLGVAIVTFVANNDIKAINIGMYIVLGIAFLIVLISFLAKKPKSN